MIGEKKESLQDGNYTPWRFYAILKEHFLIVFEDPMEESKRVGGWCTTNEDRVFFKYKYMEKNSYGKFLIDFSRASKITPIGDDKNFKAQRGSVCIEYNEVQSCKEHKRYQDQRHCSLRSCLNVKPSQN